MKHLSIKAVTNTPAGSTILHHAANGPSSLGNGCIAVLCSYYLKRAGRVQVQFDPLSLFSKNHKEHNSDSGRSNIIVLVKFCVLTWQTMTWQTSRNNHQNSGDIWHELDIDIVFCLRTHTSAWEISKRPNLSPTFWMCDMETEERGDLTSQHKSLQNPVWAKLSRGKLRKVFPLW